jgi:hypothetical protein
MTKRKPRQRCKRRIEGARQLTGAQNRIEDQAKCHKRADWRLSPLESEDTL